MPNKTTSEGCPHPACNTGTCFRFAMLERLTAGEPSGFGPIRNYEDLLYFGHMMFTGCVCAQERVLELRYIIQKDIEARKQLISA